MQTMVHVYPLVSKSKGYHMISFTSRGFKNKIPSCAKFDSFKSIDSFNLEDRPCRRKKNNKGKDI